MNLLYIILILNFLTCLILTYVGVKDKSIKSVENYIFTMLVLSLFGFVIVPLLVMYGMIEKYIVTKDN